MIELTQQIRASGGGASQFSMAAGNPLASLSQFGISFFALDDWRVRPNLTVSLGLRYEAQTRINDHHDVAPRVGVAWGWRPRARHRRQWSGRAPGCFTIA